MVQYKLRASTGILLWAFVGQELPALLRSLTRLLPEEIREALVKWEASVAFKNTLPALGAYKDALTRATGEPQAYLERLKTKPDFAELMNQLGGVELALAPIENLISPLALIDHEYVEGLRAELTGDDALALTKFAIPEAVVLAVRAMATPQQNSVTFVSPHKTFVVGQLQINQIPNGGVEVKFLVTNTASLIIVSQLGERLYLRSGIHRAFLLASLGVKEIPCLITRSERIPPLASSYPTFGPGVLTQPRPPLLADYFEERLALTAPIQKMQKVIRITAEEFLVPSD